MQLNQNPLKEINFNNFGGGYSGAKGVSTLDSNEAQDLDNIIIIPDGGGFRNRNGNTELSRSGNLSTVTLAYQGLQSFKTSTTEYLIGVRGIGGGSNTAVETYEIGTSNSWTIRHTYVASGQSANNIFTIDRFQGLAIGVGAHLAPFKITMSTLSGASLGGSPPSGSVLIVWNNRAWIGNTTAAPSKLSYSVLNDPEDWSSSGSGFVQPSAGDGDELTAVCPISNNVLLFFKRNNIYQVVGRTDPFSVFPLFHNTGCIGQHAVVNADGLVYYITPRGRMEITDGDKILDEKDLPKIANARDLWDNVPNSRLPYIQGFRQKGKDFDWIVWNVSYGTSQSTNNYAVVWDITNKCWLKHSTGYNGNVFATSSANILYMGGYAGRVYQLDVTTRFTDDSGVTPAVDGSSLQVLPTNPIPIRWFWRSDDLSLNSLENIVQVDRINVLTEYQSTGVLKYSYGYDGFHDQQSITRTLIPSLFTLAVSVLNVDILGGFRYLTDTIRPLGRGQTFNLKLESSSTVPTKITKYTLSGRQAATKVREVR